MNNRSADKLQPQAPGALAILMRIQDGEADAIAALRAVSERHQEVAAEVGRLEGLLAERNRQSRGRADDLAAIAQVEAELAKARAGRARLSMRMEQAKALWEPIKRTLDNCTDGILTVPATRTIVDRPWAAPKLKPKENTASAVDRLRNEIAVATQDRGRIQTAPEHSSVVKARARRQIESLAELGRPDVALAFDGREIEFPSFNMIASGMGVVVSADVPDGRALLAWLMKDLLLTRIEQLIDEEADDSAALTGEQRKQALRENANLIFRIERDECVLVALAQQQGEQISYRPDADWQAILQVEVVERQQEPSPPYEMKGREATGYTGAAVALSDGTIVGAQPKPALRIPQ